MLDPDVQLCCFWLAKIHIMYLLISHLGFYTGTPFHTINNADKATYAYFVSRKYSLDPHNAEVWIKPIVLCL